MNKRKLIVAILSLLLCFALLLSSSFAWFSLSVSPEISGIDTYVGSNGSLEVALLSNETYTDPSAIRTAVGDSVVVQQVTLSNLSWGNLIDLSDQSYGLSEISMIPARLNVYLGEEGDLVVNSNMLSVPQYGIDGRFSEFLVNTVSALYNGSTFSCTTGEQQYGVRGIGSVEGVTAQQSALANARSLVKSYQTAAITSARSAWVSNGRGMLDILYRYYSLSRQDGYTAADLALLRDTAVRLNNALSYVDLALRQGVVGMIASSVEDVEEFRMLQRNIENTSVPLSLILDAVPGGVSSDIVDRASSVDQDRLVMRQTIAQCDALASVSGNTVNYSWSQISEIFYMILKYDNTYLGNVYIRDGEAFDSMMADNTLTLTSASGVFSNIALYCGDYSTFFEFARENDEYDSSVEVIATCFNKGGAVLDKVSSILTDLDAASGDATVSEVALEEVFGYAVDLAFRCNESCDLLLQTEPDVRVEEDLEFVSTQGGGSYMRFASEQLSKEQILFMMDAIRIAFLDNQSRMIALAKLNTSNYSEVDEMISAPLYMYEYYVSADGSISIGERNVERPEIMQLTEDLPSILTVVVWLDGDHVDNSLASIGGVSMTGALNLQFAGSADLLPSGQDMKTNE